MNNLIKKDQQKADSKSLPASLKICRQCNSFNEVPELTDRQKAFCQSCGHKLSGYSQHMSRYTLAFGLTGLVCLTITLFLPIMDFNLGGQHSYNTLLNGAADLYDLNFWWLGTLVLFCSVLCPLLQFIVLVAICLIDQFGKLNRLLPRLLKTQVWVAEWAMLDVFLLGIIVGFVKISDFGGLEPGLGLWFFIVSLFCLVAAIHSFNPEQIWQKQPAPKEPEKSEPQKLCLSCDFRVPLAATQCPRCHFAVPEVKKDSLNRTWALTLTGLILLIPANVLPVMQVMSFGRSQASTITSGILQLIQEGMLMIGVLVFIASIAIPFLKLVSLLWILMNVHRGKATTAKQDSVLYTVVCFIGRWSMLDLFMISILVALVNMGVLANIQAMSGATAFSAVVVITILAANSFDPRLIWLHHKHTSPECNTDEGSF